MINNEFWQGRRVFITGHTGFKGSWLCLWLHELGARVTGYALDPPTEPNLFDLAQLSELTHSIIDDVRNADSLRQSMLAAEPEVVIHMAAQPLVRDSYKHPVDTFAINVMGTVNLLEAARRCGSVKAIINVTTDKCYQNREWIWGYRESDPLGGNDPYSSSKACSELVTDAYRNSFFNPSDSASHEVGVASARAGNVIGGGDWAVDRLIPDCVRFLLAGQKIIIRSPGSIRPWQHVLEPLCGYLLLAERLYYEGARHSQAWNFGPNYEDAKPVEWLAQMICKKWGMGCLYEIAPGEHPHEAHYLRLDCAKAKMELGWRPMWNLEKAIEMVVEWTMAYSEGKGPRGVCLNQIKEYSSGFQH